MSESILLRKLTLKSQLKFGKHADLTVQQLFDLGKKKYLRWVYFNCSNITFMDDILDLLNIGNDFRFDKPAKNVELFEKHKEIINNHTYGLVKYNNKRSSNKKRKSEIAQKRRWENQFFSKDALRLKNQGKR